MVLFLVYPFCARELELRACACRLWLKMARQSYSVARLEGAVAAALSARRVQFGENLDCKLLPLIAKPKKDTDIQIQWWFKGRGCDKSHLCRARCDNFFCQGVPFPSHWETALQALALDERAVRSCEQLSAPCLDCLALGVPKKQERADIVTLPHLGAKRDS